MLAIELYNKLEKDFVKPGIIEDWYDYMADIDEYICANFKKRSMGLLCDYSHTVNKVYTAVFPSESVLLRVLEDNVYDAMVFLHHPLDWDLNKDPDKAFHLMNTNLLDKLKERRISLFNYHIPLDNYGDYGNSKTLAEAMDIEIEKPFALYSGTLCGVIGVTDCADIHELNQKYSTAVGHETKLYQYGESGIIDSRVAVVAGGGNDTDVVCEVIENGVNVLITGVSVKNSYSETAHAHEIDYQINLIGGTHYISLKKASCLLSGTIMSMVM